MPLVTRVVIADDHPAVRNSLRTALLASGDFEIVGEAATGLQALRVAAQLTPDVVILDLHMPEMDGIDASARILDNSPSTAVVMQSLAYTAPYVLKALGAGVRGFVAKDDGMESVLRAIEMVRANELYLSPAVLAELRSTTASLFASESTESCLSLFDREAPTLLQWATTVTSDPILARHALLQSFLAYAIARIGANHIPDGKMWLLLSVTSSLYGRCVRAPKPASRTNGFRSWAAGAIQWRSALSHGHASHGDFISFWLDTLPASSTDRLWAHLRNCPSCHLEWCLVGFAHSSARPDIVALQDLRAELADEMTVADLAYFASAWSNRGRAVRRLMASELQVLLGSAASREWVSSENSSAPDAWATEFLGSRARRESSDMRTAMQTAVGLAR